MMVTEMSDTLRRCLEACSECADVCTEMMRYCLEQGGEHADSSHIRLLLDCAEACRMSANFMLRQSDASNAICSLAAGICDRCASDCERFVEDVRMMECAEVCRRCADACREMTAI